MGRAGRRICLEELIELLIQIFSKHITNVWFFSVDVPQVNIHRCFQALMAQQCLEPLPWRGMPEIYMTGVVIAGERMT